MSSYIEGQHDDALAAIMVEKESIIGFLSTIFDFLARRTDFYEISTDGSTGLPPGVAEQLTLKVLQSCDPVRNTSKPVWPNDFLCDTVAQEVEVEAEDDDEISSDDNDQEAETAQAQANDDVWCTLEESLQRHTLAEHPAFVNDNEVTPENEAEAAAIPPDQPIPPVLPVQPPPPTLPPVQRNSESYNGAVRENYSWAQTITDVDITVELPAEVQSSRDVVVRVTATDVCVSCARSRRIVVQGAFRYKIKPHETYWSISGRRLLIHLEKQQERWWRALLVDEPEIDLGKIDCSRPLYDLPDEDVAKARQLQWNHEQRMRGLPTTDQHRNAEILRRAWDKEGSPFHGTPFDPSVLHN